MSSTPVVPAPAKLSAIQIIEQEIGKYIQQREQSIANLHAMEGAIQAGQQLLAKLKAAESEAAKAAEKVVEVVEGEASKVVEFVAPKQS